MSGEQQLSEILDFALVQPPNGIVSPMPVCAWVILDCGHWYKWTGAALPSRDKGFPCPSCEPIPQGTVLTYPDTTTKETTDEPTSTRRDVVPQRDLVVDKIIAELQQVAGSLEARANGAELSKAVAHRYANYLRRAIDVLTKGPR